jgi:hypothetical protein
MVTNCLNASAAAGTPTLLSYLNKSLSTHSVRVNVWVNLWLEFYSQSVRLAPSPLRLTTTYIFLQLNAYGLSAYVTSSLMRGMVCRWKLMLLLASAFILALKSHETHHHTLPSQTPNSPNLEGEVLHIITPGKGWSSYNPRHWVRFPSPLSSCRVAVEVFELTSTRGFPFHYQSQSQSYLTTDGQ